ncbi:hypothetical protein VTJ49DRAFT_7486 [Mycothermus thermophilus]|uniref:Uncharacterized protein n=1 Tax=Humicola insolens TaxID=85995 RepID=A0ABR3VQI0_HUMIN
MSQYAEKFSTKFKEGSGKVKDKWQEKKGAGIRGNAKSLVGRGDDNTRRDHRATPIGALRDPSTFGPPPKRNPNAVIATPSREPKDASSTTIKALPAPTSATEQDTGPDEPSAPHKPFVADTTGLSTAHLPPPPVRRDGADARGPAPPPPNRAATTAVRSPAPAPRPALPARAPTAPPSLPPRLPPRSSTSASATPSPALPARPTNTVTSTPPPPRPTQGPGPEQGYLNQSAIARLGAAGVSVPGLGIGSNASGSGSGPVSSAKPPPPPPPVSRSRTTTGTGQTQAQQQLNELQSRFARARLGTQQLEAQTSSPIASSPALSTSSSISAATSSPSHPTTPGLLTRSLSPASPSAAAAAAAVVAGKKKPPPPPPPKKKNLALAPGPSGVGLGPRPGPSQQQHGQEGPKEEDIPPPIPLATRPRF